MHSCEQGDLWISGRLSRGGTRAGGVYVLFTERRERWAFSSTPSWHFHGPGVEIHAVSRVTFSDPQTYSHGFSWWHADDDRWPLHCLTESLQTREAYGFDMEVLSVLFSKRAQMYWRQVRLALQSDRSPEIVHGTSGVAKHSKRQQ